MAGKRIIVFLLALATIQLCIAGRTHRETAVVKSSEDEVKRTRELNYAENAQALGISVETYMKLTEAFETTRELSNFHKQITFCSILDPDEAAAKLNSPPKEDYTAHDSYLAELEEVNRYVPQRERILFTTKYVCTYVRNPEYDEEYAKSLELDRIQYHQFQDIQRRNSDNSIAGRVAVTRKLCEIFLDSEIIAQIPRSPVDLTEEQLIEFGELDEAVRTADDWTRSTAFRDICRFLNETVSLAEQAQALKIPIDLNQRIVAARRDAKNYGKSWISVIRRICREINLSDGVFNVQTIAEEVELERWQLKEVTIALTEAKTAENSEKIGHVRNACIFLNESNTDEELAGLSGVSLDQYNQILLARKNQQNHSLRGKLELTLELCQVINTEFRTQNHVTLTPKQLREFERKAEPIGSAPIGRRIPLLRDVCTWITANG